MAIINGTSAADFIHRNGDGFVPSLFEINTVTTGIDTISGGAGGDIIFADNGNDTVNGDDGNDVIHGGQGADIVRGGVGNDTFRMIGISDISGLAETIDGGNDHDIIDFQSLSALGAVNLATATILNVEELRVFGNDLTLTSAQLASFLVLAGTGGVTDRLILSDGGTVDLTGAAIAAIDELRGNAQANVLNLTGVAIGQVVNTLGGADTVFGSNGGDIIDGGTAADRLDGAAGSDTLTGGDANDTVNGGTGNDLIVGGTGVDILRGDEGNDTFRFDLSGDISGLAETVDGGNDFDRMEFLSSVGSSSVDLTAALISNIEELQLGNYQVTLTAGQLGALVSLTGTGGVLDRIILSSAGVADLTGASIVAIDELRGSDGADTITLTNVLNGQFIDGREGADALRGSLSADNILGGDGSDQIFGNSGNDVIRGDQGADVLSGGTGNDTFQIVGVSDISGLAETVNGGADTDTLDFNAFSAFGNVNLSTASLVGIEILRFGSNSIIMTAAQTGGFDQILGGGGFDRITLSAAGTVDLSDATVSGVDEFRGTGGADTFILTNAIGGVTINGLGGADSLAGGDGADALNGGNGDDVLAGSEGSDVLTGGTGIDTLTGGLGVDRFDFNDLPESGVGALRDVITDFVRGQDIIDLFDLDANLNVVGNQQFSFIGGAAFTAIGQLRYSGGVLSADVDGDKAADFQIALTGSPSVTLTDLVL